MSLNAFMNVSSSTAPELLADALRFVAEGGGAVDPWVLEDDKLVEDEQDARDSF